MTERASPLRVTADQVRWHRVVRSRLGEGVCDSPAAAASVHFGIQAQINSAARVAVANRSRWGEEGPPDLEALVEQGELVRCWGQRGTLHFYQPQDWPLLGAPLLDHVVTPA